MTRLSPNQVCNRVIEIIDPPNGRATNPRERLGKSKLAAAIIVRILSQRFVLTTTDMARLLGYKDHTSVCTLRRQILSGLIDLPAQSCGWPTLKAAHAEIDRELGLCDLADSSTERSPNSLEVAS
jgi:ribosomal protein L15E